MCLLDYLQGVFPVLVLIVKAKFVFRLAIWCLVVFEPDTNPLQLTRELPERTHQYQLYVHGRKSAPLCYLPSKSLSIQLWCLMSFPFYCKLGNAQGSKMSLRHSSSLHVHEEV